ncbi:MAG: DUF433 domain-containing protein [Planctomycetaceae bacterium]|nr:DUF433 domain-containing protein [Planctomycetaceae bacterium]
MPDVAALAEQINQLAATDREQLAGMLAPSNTNGNSSSLVDRLATPIIVATPGVCGGSARIIRTRIPVWTLARMRELGVSEADILRSFPALRAIDLVQAWAYLDTHRAEIEQEIRENEED